MLIAISFLALYCIVYYLSSEFERNERFGNVAIAIFGSFFVFPVLGRTVMFLSGTRVEVGESNYNLVRLAGCCVGLILICWSIIRAVNA